MKDLVSEVIGFDKEAQETILALEKEKNDLSIIIKNIKQKLVAEENAKYSKLEAQIEKETLEKFNQEVKSLEEKKVIALKKLEDDYNLNQEKWLEELFEICLK